MFSQFSGTLGAEHRAVSLRAGGALGRAPGIHPGQVRGKAARITVLSVFSRVCSLFMVCVTQFEGPVIPYLKTCPLQEYSGMVVLYRLLSSVVMLGASPG